MRRGTRGRDRAETPALPLGEALHPVALAALAILVANDWWIKPRHVLPGAWQAIVAGKLSDLAGLAFAPVVLSALIGLTLAGAARLGAAVDPSLSRRRLVACIVATGAVFAAVKLSPAAGRALAAALSLWRPATIVCDPTDLACLPALAVAWWIGRDELRRVPLGRPAAIHRLGRPAAAALADVAWAGGATPALAAAIDRWDVPAIDALLTAGTPPRSSR
ncbi:MAG TPA: hypothetical protein VFP84_14405 [Kofleriaceae bacterium]|nr:hypothetical protein [Kofleriaceae bacterium]